MSKVVKMGPLFDRAVFDGAKGQVRYRGRTVARSQDIQQLRLREYITPYEEEQLLNLHPEVEKKPRTAELYVDLKDGRSVRVASLDQGGLLLSLASEAATQLGVPLATERAKWEDAAPPAA